jgi:hypothetical protein
MSDEGVDGVGRVVRTGRGRRRRRRIYNRVNG